MELHDQAEENIGRLNEYIIKSHILKVGRFSHADAGQMHMYLNYARDHWMKPRENPPVGVILVASKGEAEAHYALEGLSNKILAAEYRTVLPDETLLADQLAKAQRAIAQRSGDDDESDDR